MRRDILGSALTPIEDRLLATYDALKALCEEELPPVAHANVRAALAVYAVAVQSLALTDERLSDLDV